MWILCAALLVPGIFMAPPVAEVGKEAAVQLATAALGKELSVGADQLQVRSAEAVQFRDTSLGCPEKGQRYALQLVDGYRVSIEAPGGKLYVIHVGAGRALRCEAAKDPQRTRAKDIVAIRREYSRARAQLAGMLKVTPRSIKEGSVRAATWTDTSLGCPRPGETYAQVKTEGFVITMEADGRTYRFHSDTSRLIQCEKEP